MKCEEGSRSSVPDPNNVVMDEEFQFLLCERCRSEVKNPKLLPCFHNLCSECLLETKPPGLCSICGTPHSPDADPSKMQENLLFAKLQANRTIYQKVMQGEDLFCGNCKKEAAFWCPECEEFMCTFCFESHQRYQKRESHEVKPLKDIRAESTKEFLAGSKKLNTLFCSKKEHRNQILSIYCNKCRQSLCCVCALLDSKHAGQHCNIRTEIEKRQRELQGMGVKLKEEKCSYDGTYKSLQKVVENMEKVRNETRAEIRQKIEEMVRTLQEKGDKFLADVEEQHKQQVQNVKKKLQDVDGVVKRMTSSEQLVEKMCLYASDNEVLEMQPFIQRSLEELKQKEPPTADFQIQARKFTEMKRQLQALFKRVTKEKDNIQAKPRTPREGCSPAKRKRAQEGKAIQTPAKAFKTKLGAREWITGPASLVEQPGTSVRSAGVNHASGIGDNAKGSTDKSPAFSCSSSESGDGCIDISSGEEITDDDSVGSSSLLQDVNKKAKKSQKGFLPSLIGRVLELDAGQGTLVFFDMKFLPGGILHFFAITEEATSLSFAIQPHLSPLVGNRDSNLSKTGLGSFFNALHSFQKPILVGYDLWSLDLPVFINTLQNINEEHQFEASVLGFLDVLPLIKERVPNLPSYTLKNMDSIYFFGQLDYSKAYDCARTLKDLCTILDIHPRMEKRPVIPYSNLKCYASLQPLLYNKLLSESSIQTLALHNVSLSTLQTTYENNPEKGLHKLRRYVNARRRGTEKSIPKLSKVGSYFQILPSSTCHPLATASQCVKALAQGFSRFFSRGPDHAPSDS